MPDYQRSHLGAAERNRGIKRSEPDWVRAERYLNVFLISEHPAEVARGWAPTSRSHRVGEAGLSKLAEVS